MYLLQCYQYIAIFDNIIHQVSTVEIGLAIKFVEYIQYLPVNHVVNDQFYSFCYKFNAESDSLEMMKRSHKVNESNDARYVNMIFFICIQCLQQQIERTRITSWRDCMCQLCSNSAFSYAHFWPTVFFCIVETQLTHSWAAVASYLQYLVIQTQMVLSLYFRDPRLRDLIWW